MAISLTSEAAEHVGRQLQSRGKGEGIRIGAVSYTHLTLPTNREV